MALLTAFPESEAKTLLKDFYGLELTNLQPLAAGSVNSNFFLTADDGGEPRSFFARIYEEQESEGALFELRVNEALDAARIPVAKPVRLLDGALVARYGDKPFAVYERLTGQVVCQEMVTSEMTRSVGRALARVHTAPLGGLQVNPSRFGFDGLDERLERVRSSGRRDLLPAVECLQELSGRLRRERPTDLPEGLIHGDLFRDNVLIREDQVVGLLDFESASRGSFTFDLMVTLLAWCFGARLEPNLARAMVEGYEEIRPLSSFERQAMVLEGSVACARFATTRLTDFSLRVAEGERPARDYQRFFDRLEALTNGELAAALS